MLNQGLTLVYVGLTNSRGKIVIPNVLTGSCEEQTVKSAYQDVVKVFVVSVLERPAEKVFRRGAFVGPGEIYLCEAMMFLGDVSIGG